MNENTTVEKIKSLQSQIAKEINTLKTDLAKQLDKSCQTLNLLHELGQKNVLGEPQYSEFCGVLGIAPRVDVVQSTGKKGEIKEAIMKALAKGGLNHSAIKTKVQATLGRNVSNQYTQLDKMVEKGTLKKSKDGIYSVV